MNIKYMNLYKEGAKQFESREGIEDNYEEVMEDLGWNAFYNDGYKCQSDCECYFIITEVYGIETGNNWMDEILTNSTQGAA